MEKIRIPKPQTERFEDPEQPLYQGSEDVILDKLHRYTDGNANCSPSDAEMLHKDFETCESYELYEAYVEHRLPTLTRMEEGIAEILDNVPQDLREDPEAKRLMQLIKGRALAIRGGVRSYVETVLKFVRMQNTAAAMRDPEIWVKIDHERRRRHDSLLKTLQDTGALLKQAYDYGICEEEAYREWVPGDTTDIKEGVFPIFSSQAIANRDLIKNWALAADFEEHYRKLTELLNIKE